MTDLLGSILDRGIAFVMENWLLLVAIAVVPLLRKRVAIARFVPRSIWWPALLSLAISMTLFALRGAPLPRYHDDYGQLLAADTFRHGRLANPPLPHFQSFETMMALQRPTYASRFPPGNGMVLALGMLIGLPTIGIWMATALAVAAIGWAAGAWLPPRWAALTGYLAALHPVVIDWSQQINSGSLPLLGGALLVGGVGRRRWWVAAVGAVLLSNSRPYEGLVLTLAVLIASLPRLRFSLAAAVILIAGALFIGIYNHAVTGSFFTLPHDLYDRQYLPWPNFFWERPRPVPHYGNEELRFVFSTWYAGQWRRYSLLHSVSDKLYAIAHWLAPSTLFALPLIAIGRRRSTRPLLVALALSAFAPLSLVWVLQSHYVAPAGALAAIIGVGLVRDCAAKRLPLIPIIVIAAAIATGAMTIIHYQPQRSPAEMNRRAIIDELSHMPGKHIVFVAPGLHDYVYNEADIPHARVIWARDLGPRPNGELLNDFGIRRAWKLEAPAPHLVPY